MKVKLYDARNGVEKVIKNVVSVAMYNGKMIITDNNDVEFVLPQDEIGNHVAYIADNKARTKP